MRRSAELAGVLQQALTPRALMALREDGKLVLEQAALQALLREKVSGLTLEISSEGMRIALQNSHVSGVLQLSNFSYQPARPLGELSLRVDDVDSLRALGLGASFIDTLVSDLAHSFVGNLILRKYSPLPVRRAGGLHCVDLGGSVTHAAARAALEVVTISKIQLQPGALTLSLEYTPAVRMALMGWEWLQQHTSVQSTERTAWSKELRARVWEGLSGASHQHTQAACQVVMSSARRFEHGPLRAHGAQEISTLFEDPSAWAQLGGFAEHELLALASLAESAREAQERLAPLQQRIRAGEEAHAAAVSRLEALELQLAGKLLPGLHLKLQDQIAQAEAALRAENQRLASLRGEETVQEGIVMRHASHCALLDGKIRPWLTDRMLDIGGSREQVEGEIRALEAAHQQQLAELKAQRESRHRWSPLRMVDRAREAGTSLIGIEGQASELRARYAESVCPGLKDLSTAERLALLWIMSSGALWS